MTQLLQPISQSIWDIKYRYRKDDQILDHSIDDTWRRVAKAIARAEKPSERKHWETAFYHMLAGFKFLPGGRILAGAGTSHKVTLFNCFVMPIRKDSLKGIFDAVLEGALTLQQGGGVGYDFSTLRPSGDLVTKTGIPASGPISFMRIWDTMCSVMLSTGARRGAMMGVLRCDHPDIEHFIAAKLDAKELRHFNVSVFVSDAFMNAVKNDESWQLVFPVKPSNLEDEIVYRQWGNSLEPVPCKVYQTVSARELWEKIIRAAYQCAEPGVLFGGTINTMNNLWYRETIHATNPCGEIPLPSYGACDLGAINLTQFVRDPFTSHASIDWFGIEETTAIATRFLDNVIDVSLYPLPAQKKQAHGTRRIGLGLTGLADMFVMLGIAYGSEESIQLSTKLMKRISNITWFTSIELAREKGIFPFYEERYLQGEFVNSLDESIRNQITQYGVRNSHHNTIAPTGTISLLAGNVSNGVEPIFRAEYNRHVRLVNGSTETFKVKDYAYWLWQSQKEKNLPAKWLDVDSLAPDSHLAIQAAMQPYIDNAISKTINIPENYPFDQLIDVYTKAYQLGLKGCTIFRPNPITGSVLEVPEEHCCEYEGKV